MFLLFRVYENRDKSEGSFRRIKPFPTRVVLYYVWVWIFSYRIYFPKSDITRTTRLIYSVYSTVIIHASKAPGRFRIPSHCALFTQQIIKSEWPPTKTRKIKKIKRHGTSRTSNKHCVSVWCRLFIMKYNNKAAVHFDDLTMIIIV